MAFMDENYLLKNDIAKKLFFEYAKDMPIYDYHNHLNPQEIYEDKVYDNIADIWLGGNFYGDHYKWRLMRACGVEENKITGNATPYEKFKAYAEVMQKSIGNPVYTFTHLELQRYFGITKPLCPETADEIWNLCNEKLKTKKYSVRNLLKMMNVNTLCTTDDPADDLKWHKLLKESDYDVRVLPAYRPDKAFNIDQNGYAEYLNKLSSVVGFEITDIDSLIKALAIRLDYFVENGCVASDHAMDGNIYENASKDEVNEIMKAVLQGNTLTDKQIKQYKGYLYVAIGAEYKKRNIAQQYHIGALRNNSTRNFNIMGPDTGYDCMGDSIYQNQLAALLNREDLNDELPKTILYCLNPRDNDMLVTLMACFQNEQYQYKMQTGTAWWFCDHKDGIEKVLASLSNNGVISGFVGMLTDSRSFLSYPRHEFFRRILCNRLGQLVEEGTYPADIEFLGKVVQDICFNNAKHYFEG